MSRTCIPNVCETIIGSQWLYRFYLLLRIEQTYEGLGACYKPPWTTNFHALSHYQSHISGSHQRMSLEMWYKSSWLVTEYIKHITACVSPSFSPFGHPTQVDTRWSQVNCINAWNLRLFATCVNLPADLRIRSATHRKSVHKFWFCKLALTYIDLRVRFGQV